MLPPPDPNSLSLDAAFELLCPPGHLAALFALAVSEDLGDFGDVTTQVMQRTGGSVTGIVEARSAGAIAGWNAIPALLEAHGAGLDVRVEIPDGRTVKAGQVIGRITGPEAELLSIERPMLNVLSYLSGIATQTRACVESLVETKCRVFDTRKTVPGWRGLAKYAVRCGGGFCHRVGLYDAVLVKDNHLAGIEKSELTSLLNARLATARRVAPLRFVEVEVDSPAQAEQVFHCEAGLVDLVLLDNMSLEDCASAVKMRNELAPSVALEASGGLTLENLHAVAATGVDRAAIGALTHSVQALDIAMEIDYRD